MRLAQRFFTRTVICTPLFAVSLCVGFDAEADVVINATQEGDDLVFRGSGSINTTGLSVQLGDILLASDNVQPDLGRFLLGEGRYDDYRVVPAFPVFGGDYLGDIIAGSRKANLSSGDVFGVNSEFVYLPVDYTSGDPLAFETIFTNETIEQFNLFPGSYQITLPSSDTITLNVVPEPGSFALLGCSVAMVLRRR